MKRILVVLPNWFGETLFATPFLRALRAAHPEAFIATLGVSRCDEVLAHNPHVDRHILYDERGRHRGLWAKWTLETSLRAMRFDAAFILRRSISRTLLLFFAGIPTRIGFDNPKSGWLLTRRVPPPAAATHKARTYLALLDSPDASAHRRAQNDGVCDYYPSEEERAQARALLRRHGWTEGRPLIALHPGANWFHKRWPAGRFAELADRLARHHPCAILVTGGPDDQPLIRAMTAAMATPPIVLAGQTTLRQLAACLERAALVVSNDTGVTHIACALRRPVVALYGPTSPALTGPLGDSSRTVVIHHPACCPAIPCYQPDHPGSPGMASIGVEEVFEAAVNLLRAAA